MVSSTLKLEGFWFGPDSSTRSKAAIALGTESYSLQVDNGTTREGVLSELAFSSRLGDMPRRLSWSDGALLETPNNDQLDDWLKQVRHKDSRAGFLHSMESSWRWVIVAFVVTVLVTYVGVRYGVPAASERIARSLPESFNETVSKQSLETLDRFMLEEAELDDDRRAQVQAQFDALISTLPESDVTYTLHFRNMGGIANAMALPGGDVIVTDAFIDMIEHPDELDSVLLHEIGHVVEHHGMTQVIQASTISVLVALAFGDLSILGDVAVGVPIFIMQNSYSRAAESEADAYAFERMGVLGKDPKHFANIILRLTDQQQDLLKPEETDEEQDKSSYFSSHPDSRQRARKAHEASRAAGY